MSEQEPSSSEKNDYGQYHYDEEEEILQVFCVVCAIWNVLMHLAEVALETLPALTCSVQAHSTIHALASAVFDLAT